MRRRIILTGPGLLIAAGAWAQSAVESTSAQPPASHETAKSIQGAKKMTGEKIMTVKRVTPVLLTDEVEPCLEFWKRLGYEVTNTVPDGNKIAFASLAKDKTEIMYQTRSSVAKDAPDVPISRDASNLYVEVDDFDAILQDTRGAQIAVPDRTTFYGAREIGVRDPAGHLIVFAYFAHSGQN
jgi:uncharacterized glyoxalase superfamily protein PhnB